MDIWNILGIEKTGDKDELKKAYRIKLKSVNPEDDPKGFMKLRRAYEEAVKLAGMGETDEGNVSGEDNSLVSKLDAIYRNYDERIKISSWEELFNSDEFVSLETSDEAFDTFIRYIMKNYYLPSKIYAYFVDFFDIVHRRKELSEKYPEDFIEYMINNATYDDLIDYYMFEGDSELFDLYIEKYYQLDLSSRKNNMDAVKEIIEELSEMDVYHPYLDIFKIRFKLQSIIEQLKEEPDESFVGKKPVGNVSRRKLTEDERLTIYELKGDAQMLLEDFPSDIIILNCIGDIDMLLEDYAEAGEIYERGLRLEPDSYLIKGKLAELAYLRGDYVASRDMYMELLRKNHYDNKVRAGMIRANQGIIEQNRRKLEENPDDNRSRLEIAWSCYQSYMFDEGLEMLDAFSPEEKDYFEYYNVKGRTYLCKLDFEKALQCFFRWKEAIEGLRDESEADDEEKKDIIDKRKRYPYVNFLIADCYIKLGDYKNAEEYLRLPLTTPHDEQVLSMEADCELRYETGEYERCLDACDRLLDKDGRSYIAYVFRAKACLALNYLRDTLTACEKAIAIYPYTVEPYIIEIKLYHKVRQYDDAKAVIERYRAILPDSESMSYYEGLTLRLEEKYSEAIRVLYDLRYRHIDKQNDLEDYDDVLLLLGDCYDKINNDIESFKCYQAVIEHTPEHKSAHGDLAYMYKKLGRYKESLDEFSKQIEIAKHPLYYINRGILNKFFGNYKSALEDFQNALSMDPGNAYCHSRMGIIYQMHREFDKALASFDRALALIADDISLRIDVTRWKARNYACTREYDKACELLKELADANHTEDQYICYELAGYLLRADRFSESKALLQDYIHSCEDKNIKLMYLKLLLQQLGSEGYLGEAVETYRLILSMDSNDFRAYGYMGRIFADLGRYNEAKEMFMKAIAIDKRKEENYYSELIEVIYKKAGILKPNCDDYILKANINVNDMKSPREYIKAARLYRVIKKYDLAMKYINKALVIRRCDTCSFGGCEEAQYEKALIYEAMKQWDMARECVLKALELHGHCGVYERKLYELSKKIK